jgi:hypothetical protein
MSVRPSACISAASTARISVNFDIWDFLKICREIPNFFKTGIKCLKIWRLKYVLLLQGHLITIKSLCSSEVWGC